MKILKEGKINGDILTFEDDQGNVVWIKTLSDGRQKVYTAWTDGGHTSYYIREEDESKTLEQMFFQMNAMKGLNEYRCSRCGKNFHNPPFGRPLFAGINCEECWKVHQEKLEDERKKGHVCSGCRQPYSNCYC